MKAGLETTDFTEGQGEKIKKQGSFCFCRQRNHLPLGVGCGLLIDKLQVGCLAAQPRTVVNDLAVDFAGCVVDKRHDPVSLAEQVVYVVVSDLGKRTVGATGFFSLFCLCSEFFKNDTQLIACFFYPQPDQTE